MQANDKRPLEDEDESTDESIGELCNICFEHEAYEWDDILLCDGCDVPVHQSCYGIKSIPKGKWFCDVCKVRGDPTNTECVLCKVKGGAFRQVKPEKEKGQWVHQLLQEKRSQVQWVHQFCANWLNQTECQPVNVGGQTLVDLSKFDKARFGLKCSHCQSTGKSAVQCSYGRCVAAVHPRCCYDIKGGFQILSIDDKKQMYCKKHAELLSKSLNLASTIEVVESKDEKKSSDTITIAIKIINRDDFQLKVDPTYTIKRVKKRIQQKEGIHVDKQRLVLGKKELEDGNTLLDYDIKEGTKLYLVQTKRRDSTKSASLPHQSPVDQPFINESEIDGSVQHSGEESLAHRFSSLTNLYEELSNAKNDLANENADLKRENADLKRVNAELVSRIELTESDKNGMLEETEEAIKRKRLKLTP